MSILSGTTPATKLNLSVTASGTPTAFLQRAGFSDVSLPVTVQGSPDATFAQTWTTTLPASETQYEGDFVVHWAYSNPSPHTLDTPFTVYTPYVTKEDMTAEYGYTYDDSSARTYQNQLAVERAARIARVLIDNVVGESFSKTKEIKTVQGEATDRILFQDRIVSFDRITVNGEQTYDTATSQNGFYGSLAVSPTNRSISLTGDFNARQFADPFGSFTENYDYTVRGVFGWDSVPQDIKDAAGLLVNSLLCDDSEYLARYVTRTTATNWQVSFSTAAYLGTGNFYVDKILERYRTLHAFAI